MQEKDSTSICSVAASAMLANPGGPQNHASSRQAGGSTTPFKNLLGAAEMAMPGPELPRSGPEAGPSAVQPVTLGLKPFVRQFNHPKCPVVDTKKQAAHTTKLCAQVSAIASLHCIGISAYIERILDEADSEKDVENPLTKLHQIETLMSWSPNAVVAGYHWDAEEE